MKFYSIKRHLGGLNDYLLIPPNGLHTLMNTEATALYAFSYGQPRIMWWDVFPFITYIKAGAQIGSTLRSKDTCPRVLYCKDPIPATWNGSGMILSLEIPKASNVGRGKMLVDAPMSTKAHLIRDAPNKAVRYKGLSPSTTRLARSLLENVTKSFASW